MQITSIKQILEEAKKTLEGAVKDLELINRLTDDHLLSLQHEARLLDSSLNYDCSEVIGLLGSMASDAKRFSAKRT